MVQTQEKSTVVIAPEPFPLQRKRSAGRGLGSSLNSTQPHLNRRLSPVAQWAREIAELRNQVQNGEDIFETLDIARPTKRRRVGGFRLPLVSAFMATNRVQDEEKRNAAVMAKAAARAARRQTRKRKSRRHHLTKLLRRKTMLSYTIGIANVATLILITTMVLYLTSFLVGGYTRISTIEHGVALKFLAGGEVFPSNETIAVEIPDKDQNHTVVIMATAHDNDEEYVWVSFTTATLTYIGYLSASGNLRFVGSHECAIAGAHGFHGHLGAICNLHNGDSLCQRLCFGTSEPYEPSEAHDAAVTVEALMETQNSYGFGVAASTEKILSFRIPETSRVWPPDNLSIPVSITAEASTLMSSNASPNLGKWQDGLFFIFVGVVLINILSRLLVCRLLFTGIRVYNIHIALRGELVGSLITSPSVSIFTFCLFALMGSHVYLNMILLGEITTVKVILGFAITIACIVAIFMRIIAVGLNIRYRSSGVMVFAYCLPTVPMLASAIFDDTLKQSLLLHQVVIEEIQYGCSTSMGCQTLAWHSLFPASASGLELASRLFYRPVGLATCFFVLAEGILAVYSVFQTRRRSGAASQSSIVHKSMRSPTSSAGSFFGSSVPQASALSSYERALAFEGRASSRFARLWASPVITVFGSYFHFISLIEDNLTMWGVLLLPLDTYFLVRALALVIDPESLTHFLIRRRMYIAVLVSANTLMPRFENRRKIPHFVHDFPFHLWNGQHQDQILLR